MITKNTINPYPKILVDEVSGVKVPDIRHQLWGDGHKAGMKEVMKALNVIDKEAYDVRDFARQVNDLIVELEANLKE